MLLKLIIDLFSSRKRFKRALTFMTVARTNSCKNVVLRDCWKLQGAVSYFLAIRSSQMNVKAASDVYQNSS